MIKIFLSHASEDKPTVRLLKQALEQKKRFTVFLDETMYGGEAYIRSINQALKSADCVIVCWSHHFFDPGRDWPIGEADAARSRGVAISVLLEPLDLPVPFNVRHRLELVGWSGDALDPRFLKLVASIQSLVSETLGAAFVDIMRDTFGGANSKIHEFLNKFADLAEILRRYKVLPWATNDPAPYLMSVWNIIVQKGVVSPSLLDTMFTALMERADPRFQEDIARIREEVFSPEDRDAETRESYLRQIEYTFALFDQTRGSEALLELMTSRPSSLPVLLAPLDSANGRPLADWLVPGARYVIVGDDMDGRTAVLYQTVAAQARRLLASVAPGGGGVDHLPVICSSQWSSVAPDRWRMPSDDDERRRVLDEQDHCIDRGEAMLFIENWDHDPQRWQTLIERVEKQPGNIIVIGAGSRDSLLPGFKPLGLLPLSDAAMSEIARIWLADRADEFLSRIGGAALVEAARRPYHLTAMCIAQRLQSCEAEIWQHGAPPTGAPSAPPLMLLDDLVDRMRTGRALPGRLRGRGYPRSENLADDAFAAAKGGGPLDTRWFGVGEATGLFVQTAGEPPQIVPLHPALFDTLVAKGLSNVNLKRRKALYLEYERDLQRWTPIMARAIDLKHAKSPAAARDMTKDVLKASPALGMGALSRATRMSPEELLACLGVHYGVPKSWSGYRPDQWRTLESRLRQFENIAMATAPDVLARFFRRLLPGAHTFDVALLRLCLHDLRAGYERRNAPIPDNIAELLDSGFFFKLAGPASRASGPGDALRLEYSQVDASPVLLGAAESDDDAWDNERELHWVEVPAFQISKTTITNEQYEAFEPSWRQQQLEELRELPANWGKLPVVRISWYEARLFAEWVGGRLPTEYEWECAAWGGKDRQEDSRPYWFLNEDQYQPHDLIWNALSSGGQVQPAAAERADNGPRHPLDLVNILGNVWEWCEDDAGYVYPKGEKAGSDGPVMKMPGAYWCESARSYLVNRAIRGGSFLTSDEDCRCSARQFAYPAVRSDVIGFRVVRCK